MEWLIKIIENNKIWELNNCFNDCENVWDAIIKICDEHRRIAYTYRLYHWPNDRVQFIVVRRVYDTCREKSCLDPRNLKYLKGNVIAYKFENRVYSMYLYDPTASREDLSTISLSLAKQKKRGVHSFTVVVVSVDTTRVKKKTNRQ